MKGNSKKTQNCLIQKCAHCKTHFSNVDGDNIIVPSIASPVYMCLGKVKYNCTHSLFYNCYHIKAAKCNKDQKYRRSSRNNKAT